jgi:hypothetical protein
LEEPVKREPSSSPSKETLHETDSEFVPNDAELHTDDHNSLSTSQEVSSTGTDYLDVEALQSDASEEEASKDTENLLNQVLS